MSSNFKNMFSSNKTNNDIFEGKSNEECREIELNLFPPEKLPPYTGKKSLKCSLGTRTVKLIFPNEEELELFGKYFKILTYVENNVPNIKMLMDLIHSLESGELEYDKEGRKFSCKNLKI